MWKNLYVHVNGDVQGHIHPWTDRHKIWNVWLRRGHLSPQKFRVNPPRGYCPTYAKYTPKTFECLLHFFSVLQKVYRRARWTDFHVQNVIWRGSTQSSAFWGWENLNIKFSWFIEQESCAVAKMTARCALYKWIEWVVAEVWPFEIIQDGGLPPTWIWCNRK